MRSRLKEKASQMPEVNLVPMMDVIMTILTFIHYCLNVIEQSAARSQR